MTFADLKIVQLNMHSNWIVTPGSIGRRVFLLDFIGFMSFLFGNLTLFRLFAYFVQSIVISFTQFGQTLWYLH